MSSDVKLEMKYGRAFDYETFEYDIKNEEHKRWRVFDSLECISRCEKLKIRLTVLQYKKKDKFKAYQEKLKKSGYYVVVTEKWTYKQLWHTISI